MKFGENVPSTKAQMDGRDSGFGPKGELRMAERVIKVENPKKQNQRESTVELDSVKGFAKARQVKMAKMDKMLKK